MRISRFDDAVSVDLHVGPTQGRKTLWGEEDAPQRGGLPVRVSTTEAKVASDEKACVSLSSEGKGRENRTKLKTPQEEQQYGKQEI